MYQCTGEQTCDGSGNCVVPTAHCDPSCNEVGCEACVDGECVFQCTGDQICDRAGNCVVPSADCDPACDEAGCQACIDGECVYLCTGDQVCDGDRNCVTPTVETHTEAHYVTQAGAGRQDGRDWDNAWSAADFNDPANWSSGQAEDGLIGPDDVVYFSGSFSTTLTLRGSGAAGSTITLDGWEDGSCDPVSASCTSSAILDHTGQNGIQLNGTSHVTIQDLRMTRMSSAIFNLHDDPSNGSSFVTIRRVEVSECQSRSIVFTSTSSTGRSEYITIEDSVIRDCAAGNSSSAGSCITLVRVNDAVIRRNHIYGSPEYTPVRDGADGIVTIECNRMLIERNRIHRMGEDGIDFKSLGSSGDAAYGGVIIRFNIFYDFPFQSGVTLQHESGSQAYVYGNLFESVSSTDYGYYPILVQRGFEEVAVWSNVIFGSRSSAIAVYNQDPSRPVGNMLFSNNTIVDCRRVNTAWQHGGLVLWQYIRGTSYTVQNNVFVDNAVGAAASGQMVTLGTTGDVTTSDYNLFFLTSGRSPGVFWNDAHFELSGPDVSLTSFHSTTGQDGNSTVSDPEFVDYGTRDLRLRATSPAIDTGRSVSYPTWWNVPTVQGVDYSEEVALHAALHPDTDWTTTIPRVVVAHQGDFGPHWDRGAYVHVGD